MEHFSSDYKTKSTRAELIIRILPTQRMRINTKMAKLVWVVVHSQMIQSFAGFLFLESLEIYFEQTISSSINAYHLKKSLFKANSISTQFAYSRGHGQVLAQFGRRLSLLWSKDALNERESVREYRKGTLVDNFLNDF